MALKTLYLVFVHGFKGDNDTFGEFPDHLGRLLQGILPTVKVKPVIYPQYETSGDLPVCVNSFKEWLVPILEGRRKYVKQVGKEDKEATTAEKRGHQKREKVRDPVKAAEKRATRACILVGHSMGGILIAETLFELERANEKQVLGVLAFDTPYLGVNAKMLSNATDRGIGQVKSIYSAVSTVTSIGGTIAGVASSALGATGATGAAPSSTNRGPAAPAPQHKPNQSVPEQTPPPSTTNGAQGPSIFSWVVGAGSLAAVTAGAAYAYTQRSAIGNSWNWIDAHLRFVKVLFEPNGCKVRLMRLLKYNPRFTNFYTIVEPKETFCRIPDDVGGGVGWSTGGTGKYGVWLKVENAWVKEEVTAHTSMFTRKTNSVYAPMCKEAARFVEQWVRDWVEAPVEEDDFMAARIEDSKERRKSSYAKSEVSSRSHSKSETSSKSRKRESMSLASVKDPSKELARLKLSDPPDRRKSSIPSPSDTHALQSPKDRLKAPSVLHSPQSVEPATPAAPPSEAGSQASSGGFLSYFWGGSETTVAEPEEYSDSEEDWPPPSHYTTTTTISRSSTIPPPPLKRSSTVTSRSTAPSSTPSKSKSESSGSLFNFLGAPKPKRANTESVISGSSSRRDKDRREERERDKEREKDREREREREKRRREKEKEREREREKEKERERREKKKSSRSRTG